jgi:hypothetical protein
MYPINMSICPASREVVGSSDSKRPPTRAFELNNVDRVDGSECGERPEICESLQSQIDKWLTLSVSTSAHLMRYVDAEIEYVLADLKSKTQSLKIFFFRHPDGTWQVFPPKRNGPMIQPCAVATAHQSVNF